MFIIIILSLLLGIVFLIKGAGWLIRGASHLGSRLGVSQTVIGLTVVALGTSLPELVINITSALSGSTDLAFGNIMGSNIANILLILGTGAMVSPFIISKRIQMREIPFALLASLALLLMSLDQFFNQGLSMISCSDGLILMLFLSIFIAYMYQIAHSVDVSEKPVQNPESVTEVLSRWKLFVYMIGGLILLIAGGVLVVESAVVIAGYIGLSETIVGLTIVAIGTSLPEMVSTIVAARAGMHGIALGNIIGSNIFNIVFILGVTAVIHPVAIPAGGMIDAWTAVLGTILLWVVTLFGRSGSITRREGFVLVSAYVIYMVVRIIISL